MLQRRHLPLLLGVAAVIGALLGVATFVFAPFYLINDHPSTRPLIPPISLQHNLSLFFVLTHQRNPLSVVLPLAAVIASTMLLLMAAMLAAWRHTYRPTWSSLSIVWAASLLVAAIVLSAYAGAGSLTQALLNPAYHFFAVAFAPSALLAVGAATASLVVPAETSHGSPVSS